MPSVKKRTSRSSPNRNYAFQCVSNMNTLRHFPLGSRWPDSPHAVISSLPTMQDVRGYEEHEPRVIEAMQSGYPRFVVHEYVRQLLDFYIEREGLLGRSVVLVAGERALQDVRDFCGTGVDRVEVDAGVFLLHCDLEDVDLAKKLRKCVQHIGCSVYSRQAEDLLVKHALKAGLFSEVVAEGNSLQAVRDVLAQQIGCGSSDVLLTSSGMSAFYAGFRGVQALQRGRGRTAWVQLGWLYLDSGYVLKEFLGEEETLDYSYDVSDVDAIIEQLRTYGDSLAAVVLEYPSNPLLQTCEVHRIAAAVREFGGVMVIDPSIASVFNVDVLPHADLLVTSLTKYAAVEGDVMSGAIAVNPTSPYYGELAARVADNHSPAYGRDIARLGHEIETAPQAVAQMSLNASRLHAYLAQHPRVKKIYFAGSSKHMGAIAQEQDSVGAVISVELQGDMEAFYDAVKVMKGPSFGTRFTLLCPFMYLAHYDLVTTDVGRTFLAEVGIAPELIRISVGTEPYEAIEAVFAEALDRNAV